MTSIDPIDKLFLTSVAFQRAYESFVLHLAVDLDVFRYLVHGDVRAQDLADTVGIAPTSAELLLNCLVTAEIVVKDENGRYDVTASLRDYLSPDNSEVRTMLERARDQCRLWINAAEILSSGKTGDIAQSFARGPAWTAQYQERVADKNRPHAHALAQHLAPAIRQARRILDVGGGHGCYATELLAINPSLEITIYDLPDAIDYCQSHATGDLKLARVQLRAGDARTLAIENTFDLVILSDLLHYFVDTEKRVTLRRSLASLVPGGMVVISKFRLNQTGTEPRLSAFFALQKHLENPNGGYLETDAHTAQLLREEGAAGVTILHLNSEKTIIAGYRPS